MKKVMMGFALAALTVSAQDVAAAREAYRQQQSQMEYARLAQNFDVLSENMDQVAERLVKLERNTANSNLAAEIEGLKAELAAIKRDQAKMREEIVAELSQKMASVIKSSIPPPPPPPPPRTTATASTKPSAPAASSKPEITGNYYEHIVEAGQTLSMIAKGYGTTIAKIKAANALKSDNLRVGQKLIVPEDKK